MADDKYYNLQAIILRNRNYKEHDKLVQLFSWEQGRLTALAKGASRPTGALRGLVQPFTHANLSLARGRGSLDIITQGELERPFISLRQDLAKIAYASYMAELVDMSLPEGKPSPEVFALLLSAFSLLDMGAEPFLAARFFELHLLGALGISPRLDDCLSCGRGIAGGHFQLAPGLGGLLCQTCAAAHPGATREGAMLSAGAVLTMRHIQAAPASRLLQLKPGPAAREEMEAALAAYLSYHLEQSSKARALLKSLL